MQGSSVESIGDDSIPALIDSEKRHCFSEPIERQEKARPYFHNDPPLAVDVYYLGKQNQRHTSFRS